LLIKQGQLTKGHLNFKTFYIIQILLHH